MTQYLSLSGLAAFTEELSNFVANIAHTHSASDITSGTISASRLPTATSSTLGAVKVGSGLTISSGVLSASGSSQVVVSSTQPTDSNALIWVKTS